MTKLKDTYPLYLANAAQQPNADLEVTDKYTGKVAFRVAQADAATIDSGIAAAVAAAGPRERGGAGGGGAGGGGATQGAGGVFTVLRGGCGEGLKNFLFLVFHRCRK